MPEPEFPCEWCVLENNPTPVLVFNKTDLCPRHNAEAHDNWK